MKTTTKVSLPRPLKAHQEEAAVQLSMAARDATEAGQTIPCREDPAAWDRLAKPADCADCPVLGACERYWLTGAVRHRTVLAGHAIKAPVQRKRPAKKTTTTAAAARTGDSKKGDASVDGAGQSRRVSLRARPAAAAASKAA